MPYAFGTAGVVALLCVRESGRTILLTSSVCLPVQMPVGRVFTFVEIMRRICRAKGVKCNWVMNNDNNRVKMG